MSWSSLVIPLVIGLFVVYGLLKGVNVFDVFLEGAADGLKTVVRITPTMIAIMLSVGMFKASGGLDLLTAFFKPLVQLFGIPEQLVPLMLMRPISGSGALAIFKDIIANNHPDSYVGRVASVMQGATETTFYTIALYFGSTKIKKTRHTLLAATSGDWTGFFFSALFVRLFMS